MSSSQLEPAAPQQPSRRPDINRADLIIFWVARVLSLLGVVVSVGAAVATGSLLWHGHPAYLILLMVVFLGSTLFAVHFWLRSAAKHRRFKILKSLGMLASATLLALLWWLIPAAAAEPALSAMQSSPTVTVTETATQIVLEPAGTASDVGVFFQPGARVEARAYAAILSPLAERGHTVVIPKQPFGIAFLSLGAFDAARGDHPPVAKWVVGGHSLGGIVSAMDAQSFAGAPSDAVVGVLFFASYPASDMTALDVPVLSISAANDGLATPAQIDAAKSLLPVDTRYMVIDGAVHSQFGDYGPQSGDGQPAITHDDARQQISDASVAFVDSLHK
ncbi:alpha/beta hydrolase [Arthrobacter sp. Sr24]